MADDSPIVLTDNDVKDSNLLLRGLRKISLRLTSLGARLGSLERTPIAPSFSRIRDELQADGLAPLNITALPGVASQPQLAGTPRILTVPTGQILQQYQDTQLLLVGSTSTGFTLYSVVSGNPTTLYSLIGSLTGGNFMTLDTVQTSTGAKTLTGLWTFSTGPKITSTADASITTTIQATSTVGTAARGILSFQSDVAQTQLTAHTSPRVSTRYGLTIGGWTELTVFSGGNGLAIGTQTTGEPLVFGTNNLEAGRFDGDQNLLLNQKITTYHGITTTAEGIPYIVNRSVFTGVSTGISAVTLYTTTATGEFRITYYLGMTTTGTLTSIGGTFGWTDQFGLRVVISPVFSTTSTVSTLGFIQGTIPVHCVSGAAISWQSNVGTSTVAPLGTYNAYVLLERMS